MEGKTTALRRRIAPSFPLELLLENDGSGGKTRLEFRLCFDMNAAAAIQEKAGLLLTDVGIWKHVGEPIALGVMFWASLFANHPEYRSDEGLEIARSYLQENNAAQIVDVMWEAYLAFVPKEKREMLVERRKRAERGEKTEDPLASKPAAPASGGSSSGPSPDTTSESAQTNSAS
jgi:hypothetical protein